MRAGATSVALGLGVSGCAVDGSVTTTTLPSSHSSSTSPSPRLADGTYCGVASSVDVPGGTFTFRPWTFGTQPPITKLNGTPTVVSPDPAAFTVASDLGGPPTSTASLTVLQGYLQLLVEAILANPAGTLQVTISGGRAASVYGDFNGQTEEGAIYLHGCLAAP